MGNDPYEGATYKDITRGDTIYHPRLGKCTFYMYDLLRQRLEVFDQYSMLRYIPEGEVPQCQTESNKES